MQITDSKKLSDIQKEFQATYPYLKIEFYAHSHNEGEGSEKADALNNELTIFDIGKKNIPEKIEFSGNISVTTLESEITRIFEIGAQVFRKSGSIWLQTTTTDHLTLDEQNQKALEWIADENISNDIPDSMDRLELE